ncbi:MAG: glycosyltransferase [Sphingomonadaceae bacterium]|nr:glycosyltransferase [Sphingomonadaceae bacterium]
MKIAVPIHSFEPGGVERVALNLCAAWQADGVEVTVILGRDEGAMKGTSPPLDYHLVPEPVPTASFETLWMIRVLRRYLSRTRADVIWASGNTYAIVAVAMKLLLGRRCPPVAIKLSNDLYRKDMIAPYRAAYHWWLRVQGRTLDHFVGMAQPMRAEIAELMRVPGDRITIIEDPSLAEAQFAALSALPRGAAPRAPHYIAVGRLAGQKNFPLLLRAFARLDDPAARLTILGEGAERPRLERLARELGIESRLSLPGHVADPLPFLAKASAFVLSSDYEGVPAVVIEALAAGLVEVGDEAGFAAAMRAVLIMPFDPAAARAAAAPFRVSVAKGVYRELFAKLAASR